MLQNNVDAIRMAGGVPHINHPNFGWAITADDMAGSRNNKLFEVYNGHPMVNNAGGSGHPSLEQTWDTLLSRGILLFGLATDDAHEFKKLDDLSSSRPGMGWVMVRAEKLEAKAIVAAIDRGDFYASTGVELAAYEASTTAITLKVKPRLWGIAAQRQHVGGLPHHVHREGWHGAPGGGGHRRDLHGEGLGRLRPRQGDAVGWQGRVDAAGDARHVRCRTISGGGHVAVVRRLCRCVRRR